nr:probable pectinesterase/pectinesterase inhibitor 46 [Arachis hypogaea]
MSSFKSYGKVDEHDQMLHQTQIKTRKRIIIITLSSIILVAVVLAAVFGILNNSRDHNSQQDGSGSVLATSVKAICDVTLYKESCYSSLSSVVNSSAGEVKPEELLRLSIKVALEEVSNVVSSYFSSDSGGHNGHFQGLNNDGRAKEALDNCKELLDLGVDHLNNSLSSVDSSSLFEIFDDLQTWLSAAGTYQQTCIEGFDEEKESLKLNATNYLKNSTEFTSNSLAIITWMKKAAAMTVSRRRRLLSSSFPEWVSSKDRKLLGSKEKSNIVVAKDGSGKYKTISEALKHVPEKSSKRTVIYVKRGVYYENVRVEKNKWNVMMIGDGMNATIVSASLNFVDGTPTFSSATFAVFGKNFIARDMGFRNTAGPQKHQAVALMTTGDEAVYYRCQFDAFQDTLYAHSNRQFYRECNIFGTVDFIFGNSAVVIQNCNIFPKLPIPGQQNTITAQGKTDPNMNTGISIQNCKISGFGNLSSIQTYLGRPWKDYSTTVFIRSRMEALINPNGWLPWVGNSAPDTIYYAEFQNYGPGASTANRVKWKGLRAISSKQATKFTVKTFLGGQRWIPASSAPFQSDL